MHKIKILIHLIGCYSYGTTNRALARAKVSNSDALLFQSWGPLLVLFFDPKEFELLHLIKYFIFEIAYEVEKQRKWNLTLQR